MALRLSSKEAIPEDAVILSESEALSYQWKIISEWENKSETKALRHTPVVLGVFSAITGIYVNAHYRSRLRLGSFGRLSTYIPIVVVPAMFSMLAHKFAVQKDIILKPLVECPLCLQIRSASLQCSIGIFYPTLLVPMSAFMFATRHFTYRLPSITQQPKEVFKLLNKLTKPLIPTLFLLLAGQAIATMYLTGIEIEETLKVQMAVQKRDRDAEEQYENERALNEM